MGSDPSSWIGGDFAASGLDSGAPVYLCVACARLGHCRLGLQVEELQPGGGVETELICGPDNEGGPGVAHGGWTAGVLDELCGHVPLLNEQLAVTGTLNVRFVKPIPVGRPLRARADIVRKEGRRWYVQATIVLSATGAVLATADAIMVERDPEHFARHRSWLAEQDGGTYVRDGPDGRVS